MSVEPAAGDLLRALVREVLTDIVRESLPAAGLTMPPPPAYGQPAGYAQPAGYGPGADAAAATIVPTARGGYAPRPATPYAHPATASAHPPAGRAVRVEDVVVRCDDDLQSFALRLLGLFDNPGAREDLRAGRLRFRLAGPAAAPVGVPAGAAEGPVQRVDKGAVTERHVKAAAQAGARIVLGRGAVLTPLAREKARALGVHVEKER